MVQTAAQLKAAAAYAKRHPEVKRKAQYKSNGKRFILSYATQKDLEQYKEWIRQREGELKAREQ